MHLIDQEKAVYAIQAFMMFLNLAKMTQSNQVFELELCREKALATLEQLTTRRLEPLAAISQLNALIEQVNHYLRAPYPLFMTDNSENLVKGEIVAFEHYLNQELKANRLTVQVEAPLFNDSLLLWEKVGVSLTATEGASEFAALVQKLNRSLPKEEHYPLPVQFDKGI